MPIKFASKTEIKSKRKFCQVFSISSETSELFKTRLWAKIRICLPNMCKSRRSRWKTDCWAIAGGEEGRRHLHTVSTIECVAHLELKSKVCKERFTLSSGTLHSSTWLSHTQLTRPYFPFSAKWWQGEKKLNHVHKVFKLSILDPKYCLTQLLCWVIKQSRFFTTSSHFLRPANQARRCLNGSATPWWSILVGQLGWKVFKGKVTGFNFCCCRLQQQNTITFFFIIIIIFHHLVPAGCAAPNESARHRWAFFFFFFKFSLQVRHEMVWRRLCHILVIM